ncbi:MAG: DUF5657 family protein [Patescibacteria group bacterium]
MTGISILVIAKIFALIGLGIYIIFALVIVRQVNLMVATIEVGFEFFIKIIAWAHLIFAIFVFITALLIL